jgi:hypothetical protein
MWFLWPAQSRSLPHFDAGDVPVTRGDNKLVARAVDVHEVGDLFLDERAARVHLVEIDAKNLLERAGLVKRGSAASPCPPSRSMMMNSRSACAPRETFLTFQLERPAVAHT